MLKSFYAGKKFIPGLLKGFFCCYFVGLSHGSVRARRFSHAKSAWRKTSKRSREKRKQMFERHFLQSQSCVMHFVSYKIKSSDRRA